jgi:hypothetical protein
MVIIFNGPSGLESSQALIGFIESTTFPSTKQPHYLKVEAHILQHYREDNRIAPEKKNTTVWKNFLREPYKIQENYWNQAFGEIEKRIIEIHTLEENPTIFLNFHACYFHRKTLEYFSLVKLQSLNNCQPLKIITLIDDIYEMHHRMRTEPDDVFYANVDKTPSDLIFEYLRILDWRSKEIMMSRFLAKNLGDIPCYVLAIKHNYEILYRLIYDDQHTAYLSHPISEVRRLEYSNQPEDLTKATEIKKEISSISEELRTHFAIFLPTTIDEFRIKQMKNEAGKQLCKTLLPRWESEKYIVPRNTLYSNSGFQDKNELWDPSENTYSNETFHQLLKTLSDTISAQVTTRDYKLVEQSKYLIIYRPLFNGNQSGGVEKERVYHSDLIRVASAMGKTSATDKTKVYVYFPIDDMNSYKKKTFEFCINDKIIKGTMHSHTTSNIILDDDQCRNLIEIEIDRDKLFEFLKYVLDQNNVRISDPEFNRHAPLLDNEESISDLYIEIIDSYIKKVKDVKLLFDPIVNSYPEHDTFDLKRITHEILEKFTI